MAAAPSVHGSKGLFTASAISVALTAVSIILVPQTLRGMFSTPFLPHAYCYLYNKSLISVHFGSDVAIWLSYVAISVTLGHLVYRTRREIPFSWMLLAFGAFIIACGFTHLMEAIVLWRPLYWLSADVKLITAVASVTTAITFPPLVPKIHDLVLAAKSSRQHKTDLEIANRELFRANEALKQEIEKRSQAEEELRTLSSRLLRLQDDERRRLSRELHDSTGQLLTGIQLNLSLAAQELANSDGKLQEWFTQSVQLTNQALDEVRTMSYLLHPPMLDEAGIAMALQWYVEGFSRRSRIEVNLNVPETLDRLASDTEVAIFRVIQESLTNIHRHSGSGKAEITLAADEREVKLFIRDYGKGLPAEHSSGEAKGKMGVGLRGMTERIRQLGGILSIRSTSPGTLIEARLPVSSNAAKNDSQVHMRVN